MNVRPSRLTPNKLKVFWCIGALLFSVDLVFSVWKSVTAPSWMTYTTLGFVGTSSLVYFSSFKARYKFVKLTEDARVALNAAMDAAAALTTYTDVAYTRAQKIQEDRASILARVEQGEVSEEHLTQVIGPALRDQVRWGNDQIVLITERRQHVNELIMICGERTAAAEAARRNLLEVRLVLWTRSVAPARITGGLTSLALLLAGRRREESRIQWMDQLAGAPEDGIIVTPAMRLRYSVGFVVAAFRYRISDIAAPAWRPVDWVLSKTSRTNPALVSIVGAEILYIQWNHGLDVLLTEGWAWCAGVAACAYGLARWLRQVRGIETTDGKQQEQ